MAVRVQQLWGPAAEGLFAEIPMRDSISGGIPPRRGLGKVPNRKKGPMPPAWASFFYFLGFFS